MSPETRICRNDVGSVQKRTGDAWRTSSLLGCGAARAVRRRGARGREAAGTRTVGLAHTAGVVYSVVWRRCSRKSPPGPASRTLRGQPGPVPCVPAVRGHGLHGLGTDRPLVAAWCLPGGSGSLLARLAADGADVRPRASAAPVGVRHVDRMVVAPLLAVCSVLASSAPLP